MEAGSRAGVSMRFLSVCSGIEAASVAWNPLGWRAVAFSEIEPFPCAVLAHHYPDTPNWGDMTKFQEWPDEPIDLLCGGTPCQSFSVAGLRKGLDDPRGNLMLTFGAIAAKYRPRWLVWENVPGVLSSNGGRDFGAFLGMLGELGYGFAYRVLDAQYFGVPQRRRRVFVVGCLGDWRSAAAVLFERHSLSGDSAPSRKTGQGLAANAAPSPANEPVVGPLACNPGSLAVEHNNNCLNPEQPQCWRVYGIDGVSPALQSEEGRGNAILFSEPSIVSVAHGLGSAEIQRHSVIARSVALRGREGGGAIELGDEVAGCLRASKGGGDKPHILAQMQVRRLAPEECEALQAFPRNYTRIPWRRKPADQCPDGPRYKALGNSWCVTNVHWIGERIEQVNRILESR